MAALDPTSPRFYIDLENELETVSSMSFPSAYIVYSKVRNILNKYNLHLEAEDIFMRMDDLDDPFFFQLSYPNEVENGSLFLTIQFIKIDDGYYKADINIMTEEELEEYIGEDEVEEI